MKQLLIILLISISTITELYSQNYKKLCSRVVDSAVYVIDTVFNNVKLKNNNYHIIIAKDKYNDKQKPFKDDDIYFSPITVMLCDSNASKLEFSDKYDENEFFFYLNLEKIKDKDSRCFIGLLNAGGGSGYTGTIFEIRCVEKPKFVPLFEFSELSHVAINESGNEFLHIEGIWNFNENEAHFSEHRYTIITYYINGENIISKKLGKTKGKYSSFDEDMPVDEIFKQIFTKETKLVKNIDLSKYVFAF